MDCEIFHQIRKTMTCPWRQIKSPGITKVTRIQPLGTLNVCTTFEAIDTVDSEIFYRISKFDPLVVPDKNPWHHQ